jgi:transposase-like protein
MAKKGQKFIKYTSDERDEILSKYLNGIPSLRLEKEYGIPAKTIRNWKRKYQNPNLYPGLGQKRGRPKDSELTKEDYRERYEILKKYQAFLKEQREKK